MDYIQKIWAWRKANPPKERPTCTGVAFVPLAVLLAMSGCATTMRPDPAYEGPFSFTPEQCLALSKERRTYRATEKTATYVSGATALLSVLFLGLVQEKAAPAASAGATLLASGVSVFAGSQVESLEAELRDGGCSR